MVWSKREDTKEREPATVFFLFRVLKFSKKKKISLFFLLFCRERRENFLKNEKKKHFSKNTFVGRERKTAHDAFLDHLSDHPDQIIVFVGCVCKEERDKEDDDDDDDDDSSDDDFDDRIVENTAEFFFPWEEEWF